MRRRARRRICRHRLRNGPVRFCATRRAGCAAASAGAICKRFLYKRQAIYVRSARQFPGWWGQGILRGRRESKGRKLVNRFVAGAIGGFFVRAGFSIGRLIRGSGHPAQQRLTQPRTLALHLLLVLRQRTRSLNPNPPLRRRPARFPFTSASIARARKAMAWEASLMAPRSCSPKAPRCTTPCARPALPFPARPIM